MKTIQARIDRLEARIRDSVCAHTIASLVRAMTEELDPEAIVPLIRLLDHQYDANDHISGALLRYGAAAEDSLRAHGASKSASPVTRHAARELLAEMAHSNRFAELGCF